MRIIIIITILLVMAFGCKTVKEVTKIETRYDSTAIAEVQRLTKVLRETKEEHQKIIQELSTTGIYFDTIQIPGDTVVINKIVIDKNGKIQAEGKLSKVLLTNQKYSQEIDLLSRVVDSLTKEDEKKKTELSKKEKFLVKEVTRTVWPWWLFALCIVIGWIGRGYWPRVKKYFIPIKL